MDVMLIALYLGIVGLALVSMVVFGITEIVRKNKEKGEEENVETESS